MYKWAAQPIGTERAQQIAGVLLGFVATRFLTDAIQEEGMLIWVLGVIAIESKKNGYIGVTVGIVVLKILLFFVWILVWGYRAGL